MMPLRKASSWIGRGIRRISTMRPLTETNQTVGWAANWLGSSQRWSNRWILSVLTDLLGFATGAVLAHLKQRAQIAGGQVRSLCRIEQEVDLPNA